MERGISLVKAIGGVDIEVIGVLVVGRDRQARRRETLTAAPSPLPVVSREANEGRKEVTGYEA